ncbi:MAG: glycosyl transferase [Bacteroidetes bacterium 4572_117]|nr:MAG: glycosyl transferase [Bacteroidetes bacterium 4572_117]
MEKQCKQEGGNKKAKINDADLPLISIITVVFNSEAYIEDTIKAVINQSYPNIEYIIIDGGSSDDTVGLIKKYNDYIDYWQSEPDNGLYYAMNKGMECATGDYYWFINSGDLPFDLSVLDNVFRNKKQFADIFYGETEIIDQKGASIGMRRHNTPEKLNWKTLLKGMKVSHQSIIVKKIISLPYNVDYKLSADFDWVIKVLKNAKSIENTKLVLSKFMDGGLSKKNLIPGLKERFRIMHDNYGFFPTVFSHFILAAKLAYYFVKNKRF